MDFKQNLEQECMKYWQEPKTGTFAAQVLANPSKFPHYKFTPKMDGEWNKMAWDGEHMYMLARARGVDGTFADRCEKVPHITEALKHVLPANTILLGELAYADITKTSKDVGSIMRSLVPKALEKQKDDENKLHFFVFDCLMWNGLDLSSRSYTDRFARNLSIWAEDLNSQFVHFLHPKPITELNDFLPDYFAAGGEGVVLMDERSPYEFGSRKTKITLKIKKKLDEFEAKVIGVLDANKLYEGKEIENWQYFIDGVAVTKPYYFGWKTAIRCEYEGRIFDVASGLNDEDRAWLATADAMESIQAGSLYAVISGMELTPDSVRHPYLVRMRDDVK